MSTPEVTVGGGKNHPTEPPQGKEPQVAIRTYSQPFDQKFVQYVFYSTYLDLVPAGIWTRLKSPLIIIIWLAISAFAFIEIPKALQHLELSGGFMISIKCFLVVASIAFGLVAVIWYVDKMVVSERIEHGLVNDMGDIQQYYLGFDTDDSHFWVLTVDDNIVGCVGLNHCQVPVMDKYYEQAIRSARTPEPAQPLEGQPSFLAKASYLLVKADDFISLCVVRGHNSLVSLYRMIVPIPDKTVLYKAHKKNEATLQRLAVKSEYQGHGLSSILIKRAILWAHQHKIEYLFATTDELQKNMATILSTVHGFQKVEEKKTGYYSRDTIWRLDVNEWIEKSLKEKEAEAEQEKATEKKSQNPSTSSTTK
ncbi:hypothetical protein BGW37DRAFT_417606 [Umbelopsis sp. PMI_123]|nr:hypothetical protein BGW37DRAFT_417606 [Umbelopsis sp. PMI_123]